MVYKENSRMTYAVMLDFKTQETFVETYTPEEYRAAFPFDDECKPTSIFDNEREALHEAKRVAKMARWTYNPTRNAIENMDKEMNVMDINATMAYLRGEYILDTMSSQLIENALRYADQHILSDDAAVTYLTEMFDGAINLTDSEIKRIVDGKFSHAFDKEIRFADIYGEDVLTALINSGVEILHFKALQINYNDDDIATIDANISMLINNRPIGVYTKYNNSLDRPISQEERSKNGQNLFFDLRNDAINFNAHSYAQVLVDEHHYSAEEAEKCAHEVQRDLLSLEGNLFETIRAAYSDLCSADLGITGKIELAGAGTLYLTTLFNKSSDEQEKMLSKVLSRLGSDIDNSLSHLDKVYETPIVTNCAIMVASKPDTYSFYKTPVHLDLDKGDVVCLNVELAISKNCSRHFDIPLSDAEATVLKGKIEEYERENKGKNNSSKRFSKNNNDIER